MDLLDIVGGALGRKWSKEDLAGRSRFSRKVLCLLRTNG